MFLDLLERLGVICIEDCHDGTKQAVSELSLGLDIHSLSFRFGLSLLYTYTLKPTSSQASVPTPGHKPEASSEAQTPPKQSQRLLCIQPCRRY